MSNILTPGLMPNSLTGIQTAFDAGTTGEKSTFQSSVSGDLYRVAADEYEDYSDGDLAGRVTRNFNTWLHHSSSPANKCIIAGGVLKMDDSVAGANYAQLDMGDDVLHMGAKFRFGAYTTANGSVALIPWATQMNNSATVPDTCAHLVIKPTQWIYGVFSGGVMTVIDSGFFATPLTADGTTEYTAEMYIDKTRGSAYVMLPTGDVVTVTDPRIRTYGGRFACWEVYRQALTDTHAEFVSSWASTGPGVSIPLAASVAKNSVSSQALPVVVQYAPATDMSVAIPTVWTTIDATNIAISVQIPRGCSAVFLEATIYIEAAAASQILLAWDYGGAQIGTQTVLNSVYKGYVTYRKKITGLVPGTLYTYALKHRAISAGPSLKLWVNPGYEALLRAAPCN